MTSFIVVIVSVLIGTFLLFQSSAGFFTAALAVFMYGHALWWIALDRRLARLRAVVRLPTARALRLCIVANVVAGALAATGAMVTLHPVFAAVVVVFAAVWITFWGWAFKRISGETSRYVGNSTSNHVT